MMLSECRREKDFEDAKAYGKGKKEMAYKKACKKYLRENPEVGTIIRNGKELFYINLNSTKIKDWVLGFGGGSVIDAAKSIAMFSPESVIEIES